MLNTSEPVLYICGALIFAVLRMLDGCNKIPRFAMCAGMAATLIPLGVYYQNPPLPTGFNSLATFCALLWAFSYGWSHTSINTMLRCLRRLGGKIPAIGNLVLGHCRGAPVKFRARRYRMDSAHHHDVLVRLCAVRQCMGCFPTGFDMGMAVLDRR